MAQPTQERLVSQLERPEQTAGNVGHAGSGTGPAREPNYQDHADDHVEHVSMKTYYLIFGALMVLLFITVGAWYFDQHITPLGHFSAPLAMAIAVAKAILIVLFFMHVKFASKLVQIFACTGIAFVAIMFLLTFNDFGTRDWLPRPGVYPEDNLPANDPRSPYYRAAAVGSSPNSMSTPSDNTVGSAMYATGNATQTAVNGATQVSPGDMSAYRNLGSLGDSGAYTARQEVATNGSASRPGPHVGGAANNLYGSAAQSKGIQPKSVAPAPAIPQSAQVLKGAR